MGLRVILRGLSPHLPLVVTGVLFTFMAIRILAVSRGDSAAAQLLVQEGDLIHIILGVAIDLIVVLAAVAFVNALAWAVVYRSATSVGVAIVVTALALVVAAWIAIAVMLVLYVILGALVALALWRSNSAIKRVLVEVDRRVTGDMAPDREELNHYQDVLARAEAKEEEGEHEEAQALINSIADDVETAKGRHEKADRRRDIAVRTAWTAGLVPVFLLALLSSQPWTPAEDITLDGTNDITAYVIGGSNGWVHMLRTDDRAVVSARMDDIESRAICRQSERSEWVPERPQTPPVWLLLGGNEKEYPKCSNNLSRNSKQASFKGAALLLI